MATQKIPQTPSRNQKKSLKIAERHLKAAGQWPVLKQWSIRVV